MAIFGVIGGIGSGKTMTLSYLGLQDLYEGKKLYSNITLVNIPKKFEKNIIYLTTDMLKNIFQKIKDKEMDMRNSTVLIQEIHNYMDSRTAMSNKNRMISYWILQSRHTGAGSCDIIFDTQNMGQVDLRLRRNTDWLIFPEIVEKKKHKDGDIPTKIRARMTGLVGQREVTRYFAYKCEEVMNKYDTHELVEI